MMQKMDGARIGCNILDGLPFKIFQADWIRSLIAFYVGLSNRLHNWRRNCLLVILGMLVLCLLICMMATFLIGRASADPFEPLPLDVVLIIDHSNSMWDKGGVGSDPDLLRVEAAHLFIAYLGVDMGWRGNRLGVIHFGGESELIVPLTSLAGGDAEQREIIRRAIARPERMGWTDPLAALELAYDVLFPGGQREPARQPVVILLTDGKPERSADSSADERRAYVADLRALVERFRAAACPIFTIALASAATDADPEIQSLYRNLWQEIAARTPPAAYHEARSADDLPHIYHAVIASLLGAQAGPPVVETTVGGAMTQTLIVSDDLAQVTFVILRSDPALAVHLRRPGGALARPGDPDVQRVGEPGVTHEEVWAIANPRPGPWSLALRGQGEVIVWQDGIVTPGNDGEQPVYTITHSPLPVLVEGVGPVVLRDITVLERGRDAPLVDPAQDTPTLQIVAEVQRAGFAEMAALARDDGLGCDRNGEEARDGRYCVTLTDLPPGACTLLLRALRDGAEIARREVAFEVAPVHPSPVSPSPSAPPSSPPAPTVVTTSRPLPLSSPPSSPPSSPVVHEAATDNGGMTPWLWLSLGMVILGSVGGGLAWRWRRRVTLEGSLRVLAAPAGQPDKHTLDLPDQPWATLGETGRRGLPLPGDVPRVTLRAGRTAQGDVETWIEPPQEAPQQAPPGTPGMGVTLNERPLDSVRRLIDGDVLAWGDYRLRYESLRQADRSRRARRPRSPRRILERTQFRDNWEV